MPRLPKEPISVGKGGKHYSVPNLGLSPCQRATARISGLRFRNEVDFHGTLNSGIVQVLYGANLLHAGFELHHVIMFSRFDVPEAVQNLATSWRVRAVQYEIKIELATQRRIWTVFRN